MRYRRASNHMYADDNHQMFCWVTCTSHSAIVCAVPATMLGNVTLSSKAFCLVMCIPHSAIVCTVTVHHMQPDDLGKKSTGSMWGIERWFVVCGGELKKAHDKTAQELILAQVSHPSGRGLIYPNEGAHEAGLKRAQNFL